MKKFFLYFSLSIFITMGIYAISVAADLPKTYDGNTIKVYNLQKNPEVYSIENSSGMADVIVKTNLEGTKTLNIINSIIYDYRSFDGLCIMLIVIVTATAGAPILHKGKNGGESINEEKHKV